MITFCIQVILKVKKDEKILKILKIRIVLQTGKRIVVQYH